MTEEQITKDRQERVEKAKNEIGVILQKYELDLTAEDMIGEHTKINVMLQFRDIKKYPEAKIAQEVDPIIEDIMGPNDSIGPTTSPAKNHGKK